MLPIVSLGLWHNFRRCRCFSKFQKNHTCSFDHGITHFDFANNYGPPPGSTEVNFGRILKQDLSGYRDELIISTKAGYGMWEGPYGDGGSRKIFALAWLLKDKRITSVLIGARSSEQLTDALRCMNKLEFSGQELS